MRFTAGGPIFRKSGWRILASVLLVALWGAAPIAQAKPTIFHYFKEKYISNKLYLKLGASYVNFNSSRSGNLIVQGAQYPATLAISNGPQPGNHAQVSNHTAGTLAVGYFLPYTHRHASFEAVLGSPIQFAFVTRDKLRNQSVAPKAEVGNLIQCGGTGQPTCSPLQSAVKGILNTAGIVLGPTGTLNTGVPPLGKPIGTVENLPIISTLVYHPFPNSFVRPYVGAGAAYLFSYDAKINNPVLTQENQPYFHVTPTWGYVLQAGLNFGSAHKGFFGFLDVRYIGDATVTGHVNNVHAKVNNPTLAAILALQGYGGPNGNDVALGNTKLSIRLNPVIYTAGIGYAF